MGKVFFLGLDSGTGDLGLYDPQARPATFRGSRLAITVVLDAGILPEGVVPKPRIDTIDTPP